MGLLDTLFSGLGAFPPAPQSGREGGLLDDLFSGGLGAQSANQGMFGMSPEAMVGFGSVLMQPSHQRGAAMAQMAPYMALGRKRNQTLEFLKKKGLSDEDAAFLSENPTLINDFLKPGAVDEYQQRADAAGQYGLTGDAARHFALTGNLPADRQGEMPTSIQEYERAKNDPDYANFLRTGKGRDSALMAGDRQAVRESEDMAMASQNSAEMLKSVLAETNGPGSSLNDLAGYGVTAGTQSWLARNDPTGVFDDQKGEATTNLENIVLNQALSSLKSIFGAAPTEGERRILVELQASVDKTPQERKLILNRAIQLAERRQAFYMDRANELRGGTYYQPGGGMGGATSSGGGTLSNGLQWSVEP